MEEWVLAADDALERLGEAEEHLARAENDLRVYLHDVLYRDHDKDYRTLVALPLSELEEWIVYVLRADYWGAFYVDAIVGSRYTSPKGKKPKKEIWVMIWQNHMRTLLPWDIESVIHLPWSPPPADWNSFTAYGWEAHLQAAMDANAELVPEEKCPRCSKIEIEDAPES